MSHASTSKCIRVATTWNFRADLVSLLSSQMARWRSRQMNAVLKLQVVPCTMSAVEASHLVALVWRCWYVVQKLKTIRTIWFRPFLFWHWTMPLVERQPVMISSWHINLLKIFISCRKEYFSWYIELTLSGGFCYLLLIRIRNNCLFQLQNTRV